MDHPQSTNGTAATSIQEQVIPGSASCTFQATSENVRNALETITNGLPEPTEENDPTARLEITLAEVLNNVVEHAYAATGEGEVEVHVEWDEAGIHCMVLDHGVEMPGLVLPEKSLPTGGETVETLPEGGFGWFMIHSLARDLSYAREDDTNRLSFRLEWDAEDLI